MKHVSIDLKGQKTNWSVISIILKSLFIFCNWKKYNRLHAQWFVKDILYQNLAYCQRYTVGHKWRKGQNVWPLQWQELALICFGHFSLTKFGFSCPLYWKGHCESMQSCSESSPLSREKTFLFLWRIVIFRDVHVPTESGRGSVNHCMIIKWWERCRKVLTGNTP